MCFWYSWYIGLFVLYRTLTPRHLVQCRKSVGNLCECCRGVSVFIPTVQWVTLRSPPQGRRCFWDRILAFPICLANITLDNCIHANLRALGRFTHGPAEG